MARGQSSTEYLVMFGVALVVAVLVIYMAMQFFNSWSKQSLLDQSWTYWKAQKPIAIVKVKVSGSTGTLVLKNTDDSGDTIRVHQLYLWSQEGSNTITIDRTIAPGKTEIVSVSLPASCHATGEILEFPIVKFTYYDLQISETTTFDESGTAPLRFMCP